MIELVRYIGIVDCVVLVVCGAFLRAVYADHVPPVLNVAAWAYGSVFVACAVGLALNIASPFPPTPGAKVFLVVATPAALVALGITWRVVRPK